MFFHLILPTMKIIRVIIATILAQGCFQFVHAQEGGEIVRLAKLVIDSAHLEPYQVLLKEEIETSLRIEPGVLVLYAVSEKEKPTHITILEIYRDANAYQSHIQNPHFIKYKNGTLHMVKTLELVAVDPLMPAAKISQGAK